MKTEVSAGGIVLRRRAGIWYVLVMRDMNDVFTFPKGVVGKTEDYEHAAIREIREEVGLTNIKLVTKLPLIRYMYQRNGLIVKTVHYYVCLAQGRKVPVAQRQEGIHDVRWMSIDEAIRVIGYPKTNRPLLLKTKQWILNSLLI